MKPPDEPEPLIRVTFRPLETPAAVSSTQERESLRNLFTFVLRLGLIQKKTANRKQCKERKNRQKKVRGLAKVRGAKKKKD